MIYTIYVHFWNKKYLSAIWVRVSLKLETTLILATVRLLTTNFRWARFSLGFTVDQECVTMGSIKPTDDFVVETKQDSVSFMSP